MNMQYICEALHQIGTQKTVPAQTRPASVLLIISGDTPEILMTKKSSHLKIHAGEIAFPGGKKDATDADLMDTAIRETEEEIGLQILRRDIMAGLEPVRTLNSGFTILPFVTVHPEIQKLRPNPEVESILHIPLEPFLGTLAKDSNPDHAGIPDMYTLRFGQHVIWGASARILKQLHDILMNSP